MAPYIARRRVEFAHTDQAGMAHFSEFFRYMESAEHELFRSLGLSVVQEWEGRRISWPRVSAAFDFEQPLRFEDEFELHLGIERMGESSISWVVHVKRDGLHCGTGRCTTVCCDVTDHSSLARMPIPSEIRTQLEVFHVEKEK